MIQALLYLIFLIFLHFYIMDDEGNAAVTTVLMILNSALFIYEIYQVIGEGFSYFLDYINLMDFTRILAIFVIYGLSFTDYKDINYYLLLYASLTGWIRGFFHFRTFTETRYFIKIFISIFRNTIDFMIIFVF